MKARKFALSTDHGRRLFWEAVKGMVDQGKEPIATLGDRQRTVPQNSMMFALYGQISIQSEDRTLQEVRRECKLNYGVPILRAFDQEFSKAWEEGPAFMSYENQILIMGYMDITSKFDKGQGIDYIDTILREYSRQGYALVHPSEVDGR